MRNAIDACFRWLSGDDKSLTPDELAGYELFKGKGCVGCHNGPAAGGTSFQKLGLVKPFMTASKAEGRFAVTDDCSPLRAPIPMMSAADIYCPFADAASGSSLYRARQRECRPHDPKPLRINATSLRRRSSIK